MPFFNTPATVIIQEHVEEAFLGRVFGVMTMIFTSVMPIGMLLRLRPPQWVRANPRSSIWSGTFSWKVTGTLHEGTKQWRAQRALQVCWCSVSVVAVLDHTIGERHNRVSKIWLLSHDDQP